MFVQVRFNTPKLMRMSVSIPKVFMEKFALKAVFFAKHFDKRLVCKLETMTLLWHEMVERSSSSLV